MALKSSILILLVFHLLGSCNSSSNNQKKDFAIEFETGKRVMQRSDSLFLSIENKKELLIDTVVYSIADKDFKNGDALLEHKLGEQQIRADIYSEDGVQTITRKITILNDKLPEVYTYRILNTYPHDITSYTQGLEFSDDTLYESTGQRGKSKLRKIDYRTGEILQDIDLDRKYFGEGLTIIDGKVLQLTWQGRLGLIYDLQTLERSGIFDYGKSQEGWGLCNNNEIVYKSDGTERIWLLNKNDLSEQSFIQAYTHKGKIIGLNELEWVDGMIYANRYQKNGVAIINPENGAIVAVIDFTPLRSKVKQHGALDVLNGIAYNPATQTIFVTGKNWDKLFEVEIITENE